MKKRFGLIALALMISFLSACSSSTIETTPQVETIDYSLKDYDIMPNPDDFIYEDWPIKDIYSDCVNFYHLYTRKIAGYVIPISTLEDKSFIIDTLVYKLNEYPSDMYLSIDSYDTQSILSGINDNNLLFSRVGVKKIDEEILYKVKIDTNTRSNVAFDFGIRYKDSYLKEVLNSELNTISSDELKDNYLDGIIREYRLFDNDNNEIIMTLYNYDVMTLLRVVYDDIDEYFISDINLDI